MKTFIGIIIGLIIGLIIGYSMWSGNAGSNSGTATSTAMTASSDKAIAFKEGMRKLWEDHIIWTRLAIIDTVTNAPSASSTLNRLLQNPSDFANALIPYYGGDAANQFGSLLKDHLTIAAELVKDAKAGNTTAATDAETRWNANADAIAKFLAGANPNLNQSDLDTMLRDHLTLTKDEAVQLISKKYDQSVADYDKIHTQALQMADTLSAGIIKQFPDKFK